MLELPASPSAIRNQRGEGEVGGAPGGATHHRPMVSELVISFLIRETFLNSKEIISGKHCELANRELGVYRTTGM